MAETTLIRHFTELDSTNSKCISIAKSGIQNPMWVLADQQTGGRGRRNRRWVSERGNLYASGLYWFDKPYSQLAELGFAAALAVTDALYPYVETDQLRLKWPNDVLYGDAKLAGILPESGMQNNRTWLVMGVGINLAHAPKLENRKTTCVADHLQDGKNQPLNTVLLPELIRCFETWIIRWKMDGFSALRSAWLSRCYGLGKKIKTSDGQTGILEDMTKNGALLLRKPSGQAIEISAGEVFFENGYSELT